jgi:hypothetical protein
MTQFPASVSRHDYGATSSRASSRAGDLLQAHSALSSSALLVARGSAWPSADSRIWVVTRHACGRQLAIPHDGLGNGLVAITAARLAPDVFAGPISPARFSGASHVPRLATRSRSCASLHVKNPGSTRNRHCLAFASGQGAVSIRYVIGVQPFPHRIHLTGRCMGIGLYVLFLWCPASSLRFGSTLS